MASETTLPAQPDPLVMPADESWTPEEIADLRARLEAALANPGPLTVLPSDHWKDRAEAAEAKLAEVRDHAGRYLRAVYGPDYIYRAPETFGNLLERWIWAVAAGVPEMAHASIADIERHCAERDGADRG
jgi:hypothetical protein